MDFFKSVGSNVLAAIIMLGAPVIVGFLAYIQDTPLYAIALAVIAAPGFALWSFGQAKMFWRMHRQTIARSRSIIREWLEKTSLQVQNSPSEQVHWRYLVRSGTRSFSVYVPRNDPELLYLGITLHIPKDDYSAVDSITADTNSTMLADIKTELVRLGIGYGVDNPLRTIQLSTSMAFDHSVTRPMFLEKVALMIRAQVLIHLLIEREAKARNLSLAMMSPVPDTASWQTARA